MTRCFEECYGFVLRPGRCHDTLLAGLTTIFILVLKANNTVTHRTVDCVGISSGNVFTGGNTFNHEVKLDKQYNIFLFYMFRIQIGEWSPIHLRSSPL